MLTVTLFGTPGIFREGEPVNFPFKKAEALVYYMAMKRSATRQELAALLWEDCEEALGLKYLRNAIYNVNKILGEELLVSPRRALLTVNPECAPDCDGMRFLAGETAQYTGVFLQGFSVKNADAFEEWMFGQREELRSRFLSALGEEIRREAEAGREDSAASLAARYLSEEPYDEEIACLLMTAFRRRGRFSRAAQIYRQLKDRLNEDLGTEPQEPTTQLYYDIMRGWSDAAPAEPEVAGKPKREKNVSPLEEAEGLAADCRAIFGDTSRAFVPFSPLGPERPVYLSADDAAAQLAGCEQDYARLVKAGTDSPALQESAALLQLSRGQLDLFAGRAALAEERFKSFADSGAGDRRLQLQLCCLMAQNCVYRQETELVEYYTDRGLRLLRDDRSSVFAAHLQRMRGCSLMLRLSYDKAAYYILEAVDLLEHMPGSYAARLQLGAAYAEYGRVCRHMHGYADAAASFKKALALLGSVPLPGKTWIYVHYARTVYFLDDSALAESLFAAALDNARRCGEPWGTAAAAAYLAYFAASDGRWEQAAGLLQSAREAEALLRSPLETGLVYYVSLMLRRLLDGQDYPSPALAALLPYPGESYARLGVRALAATPDVFESEWMSNYLRQGLFSRDMPQARNLYSKTKHFMSE